MEQHILIDTLKQHPLELAHQSAEVQDNADLVQVAVKKNGLALQYASNRLRGDYDTVLTAVKKTGGALEFASEELQNNREIVYAAVTSDNNALRFVPEALRHDRALVLIASDACRAEYIPEEFLGDYEIAQNLIAYDSDAYRFISDDLACDINLLTMAIEQDSSVLDYAPEQLTEDKETMMQLVKVCSDALYYASEELKQDKELVLEAMGHEVGSWAYDILSLPLKQDPDVLRAFVAHVDYEGAARFGCYFNERLIPQELLEDDAFITEVLNLYREADDLPEWTDKAFALRAIQLGNFDTDFFSEDLMMDEDVQAALARYEDEEEAY